MSHLEKILEKLKALGRDPTPDQLAGLREIQAEIDKLYEIIQTNQQAFDNPLYVGDGSEVEIIEVEYCCYACKEDDGGVCSTKRGLS